MPFVMEKNLIAVAKLRLFRLNFLFKCLEEKFKIQIYQNINDFVVGDFHALETFLVDCIFKLEKYANERIVLTIKNVDNNLVVFMGKWILISENKEEQNVFSFALWNIFDFYDGKICYSPHFPPMLFNAFPNVPNVGKVGIMPTISLFKEFYCRFDIYFDKSKPILVLNVDDDILCIKLNQKILKGKKNIIFEHCSCGEECLEKIKNTHYDIILLDISMKDMTGYVLSKEIRSLYLSVYQTRISLPFIIAVSSNCSDRHVKMVARSEMNGYVIKPFLSKHFETILSDYKKFPSNPSNKYSC
jgi:CheY-like chemotaxis protein